MVERFSGRTFSLLYGGGFFGFFFFWLVVPIVTRSDNEMTLSDNGLAYEITTKKLMKSNHVFNIFFSSRY